MKQKKCSSGQHATGAQRQAVRSLLGDTPRRPEHLLRALHRINDHHGSLPETELVALADLFDLTSAQVFEVASFYHHFRITPSPDNRPTVRICRSPACRMHGAEDLAASLQKHLGNRARIERVPCVGRCASAPVAVAGARPIAPATTEAVETALATGEPQTVPLNATRYRDYRRHNGYTRLAELHARGDPTPLTDMIEQSGLRGLGGAGFPAARKWRVVRQHPGPRQMVVNIDEGEPGTFKDRHLLETEPHRCIEGTLIAAWAVDAEAVHFYLRDEYAAGRVLLEQELAALQADPPCPLPAIHLHRGAGAYICGEETALIESIEGKRGMPRLRPPYIAERGLFGQPTLAHNWETLYWVTEITEKGPAFYRDAGRHGHHGLRYYSLSGRVRRPGVYRAPAGITLRELIEEHGGGMAEGHELRAFLPGGLAGGLLPASLADEPLDFDTLQPHGAFLGSAAILVLSQQDDIKATVIDAMHFFAHESCGQCTPCRVGTEQALVLLRQPRPDRALLSELASVMQEGSICGLGQAAPNPFLCLLRHFPDEVDG